MKKRYTRSRAVLFVGLFSFHTLSSCVHTGRELGMGLCQSKPTNPEKASVEAYKKEMKAIARTISNGGESIGSSKTRWYKSKRGFLYGATSGVIITFVLSSLCYFFYLSAHSDPSPCNPQNATTDLVPTTGSKLVNDVVNRRVDPIGSSLVPDAALASTTMATIIAALRSNRLNQHNNSSSLNSSSLPTTVPFTPTDIDTNTIPSSPITKDKAVKLNAKQPQRGIDLTSSNPLIVELAKILDALLNKHSDAVSKK